MLESHAVYIVSWMGAAWSRQLSRETIGIYAQEIVDADYGVAMAAAHSLARTSDHFPSIAMLLAAIRRESEDRRPDYAPLAPGDDAVRLDELPVEQREAWAAVRSLLSKWGGE